jgi:hypothetical protein
LHTLILHPHSDDPVQFSSPIHRLAAQEQRSACVRLQRAGHLGRPYLDLGHPKPESYRSSAATANALSPPPVAPSAHRAEPAAPRPSVPVATSQSTYPSSRLQRETRRRDSYPPPLFMVGPEIFSKIYFNKTPPVRGFSPKQ